MLRQRQLARLTEFGEQFLRARFPCRGPSAGVRWPPRPAMPSALLFADRLPPLAGGMEMHARYFSEYFSEHPEYRLLGVVTRDEAQRDCLLVGERRVPQDLHAITGGLDEQPAVVFFNSGRWIEDIADLRAALPASLFVYRTGGNEISKAPLERRVVPAHRARQRFWVDRLNQCLDLLVTNSAFTEERLAALGVRRDLFFRCVGGVNVAALRSAAAPASPRKPVLFSAARFVPYKNHELLLESLAVIRGRGVEFCLRLAGDGPLLADARGRADRLGLASQVEFLGRLTNEQVCDQMVGADFYVQLSTDFVTEVPGGAYIHSEGMGRSILEAIACGTHVIAGRSGALPEVVTPDRGLLVELGTPETVADALEPLLRSPPLRRAIDDSYAWERIFTEYVRRWKELGARSRRH